MFLNCISACFEFASPFIIKRLVTFIEEGQTMVDNNEPETWESAKPGIILAGLLIGTQLAAFIIQEHLTHWQVMTGV